MFQNSVRLPQNPAFVLSTQFNVLVSTYQLEEACSRVGSIYILSHDLDIIRCIVAPAGVFRFELLDSDVVIAAVTDGSLFITTFNG
uniref:Vps16_N domain-containing protein n=1 Tax=Angiostrongylus cantonensis TaxID=6313 RepID=A0A0K0DI52_ANGCA